MKSMGAFVYLVVSFLLIGSFGAALEARAQRRKSALPPVAQMSRKKKPMTAQAQKKHTTGLKYLPKLGKYVKPVKGKKRRVQVSGTRQKGKAKSTRRAPFKSRTSHSSERIFSWPVDPKNFWVSSPFGPRTIRGKKGFHGGIDLAAATGTDVYAAQSGKVVESRYSPGYGNYIMIAHANGYKSRYAHLHKSLVKQGQQVSQGELIGEVGATGHVVKRSASSSGSHLHFELYKHGEWVDPAEYIG